MSTLKTLFLDELADMYDAEHRILKALPKLIKAATCLQLQLAFAAHMNETEGQVERLKEVFESFGLKARGKRCEATVGLLREGDQIAAENKGKPTINAALISAGQKVEHYEIASYGCLRAWAIALGNDEAASLLGEILVQEKEADQKLVKLAVEKNREALVGAEGDGSARHASTDKKPLSLTRRVRKLASNLNRPLTSLSAI